MMSIGSGMNPIFIKQPALLSSLKSMGVQFLEVGPEHLTGPTSCLGKYNLNLSLHIARSPITEKEQNQLLFYEKLEKLLKHTQHKLVSLGFHLNSERSDNIGRYGFSSHYQQSDLKEQRAIQFINEIHYRFKLPVWLESANFYSPSSKSIKDSYQSMSKILDATGAKMILDLTHLYIDAMNCDTSPLEYLQIFNWDQVVEIHLSGVIQGTDNNYHDGHNQPIHNKIWELFEYVKNRKVKPGTIITIEHSDSSWAGRELELLEDFKKLAATLNIAKRKPKDPSTQAFKYAISYLRTLILKKYPGIDEALSGGHKDFQAYYQDWIEQLPAEKRLTLTDFDILPGEHKTAQVAYKSFVEFLERSLKHEACN